MKKYMKNMVFAGLALMLTAGSASAEVVVGGYSFNDPTPRVQSNAVSVTENRIINVSITGKATPEEKKYFTSATFFANLLKPNAILLFNNLKDMKQCESYLNDFNPYVAEKYASKGFHRSPIVRGTFASSFEPEYVKFGKFTDGKTVYNVTTGCKQKEGFATLFYQVDKM